MIVILCWSEEASKQYPSFLHECDKLRSKQGVRQAETQNTTFITDRGFVEDIASCQSKRSSTKPQNSVATPHLQFQHCGAPIGFLGAEQARGLWASHWRSRTLLLLAIGLTLKEEKGKGCLFILLKYSNHINFPVPSQK